MAYKWGVTNHLLTGMMNLQVNPSPLPASLGSKSPREASICRGRQSSDESQPAIADDEGREQIRLMVKNPKKTPGMYKRTYQNLQPKNNTMLSSEEIYSLLTMSNCHNHNTAPTRTLYFPCSPTACNMFKQAG